MLGQAMEAEIREQPDLLAANAAPYLRELTSALADRRIDLVLLAGRGTSDHAALYARYLIEIFLGIPVTLSAPSVITRYKAEIRYRRTLAIGISQSGAAPDVAEVLDRLHSEGHLTLAITNTPGSAVTKVSDFSLCLNAGPERSVPATKTYTTTLLALYQAVRAMGGSLPDPTPWLPSGTWVEQAQKVAEEHATVLVESAPVFSLGRGYAFASALEGALKLMESALVPAKGYSTADFEHGPRALAGEGSAAVVYGSAPVGLEDQGCQVLPCPMPNLEIPEPLQPLWQAVYAQWLALLAARRRNLDPDQPQFIRKVTRTR